MYNIVQEFNFDGHFRFISIHVYYSRLASIISLILDLCEAHTRTHLLSVGRLKIKNSNIIQNI